MSRFSANYCIIIWANQKLIFAYKTNVKPQTDLELERPFENLA